MGVVLSIKGYLMTKDGYVIVKEYSKGWLYQRCNFSESHGCVHAALACTVFLLILQTIWIT